MLAALFAVIAAVLGFLYWDATSNGEAALREEAVVAATEYGTLIGTYDHSDLKANVESVRAISTDSYAEEYETISTELEAAVAAFEATSVGTVTHAAVESISEDSATVLVFLDQDVNTNQLEEQGITVSRLVMTLAREGDRWLLDGAEPA
ncbi:hypothetical protein HT102_15640 [Hoyosella sp. G463]|uniref:Mce-associated membrane protein n=1 Tax=Lolliginicoccus lacisalsi TaxID=2742202 RepID=A0A927PNI8_9ACTN|nr:hypothetical protein [Lolliginicoccus lacisalsi]MBD8507921.1 hypothetical protein [Lolliginicoccus lacisalsi]